MVLELTAASPAPRRAPARRERTADEPHRSSTWKADVQRSLRRQVAAGRDEALVQQADRLVDGDCLDHAVEIEEPARLDAEQPAGEIDSVPASALRRPCGKRIVPE